jgi:hypothetical protein
MATLPEITNKVDKWFEAFWKGILLPKELAYFKRNGRFFQLLITPETPLENGLEGTFNLRLSSDEVAPDDIKTLTVSSPVPAQIEVHIHEGFYKHGFTAHVWVKVLGKIYHRSKGYGDVDTLDQPWHEVEPTNTQ